jgi:hypothetical protein
VADQPRLNSHQRDTLAHVFRHPASHNIEWHSVVSLLNAIGNVQETHRGHLLVTVEGETETFDQRHKDIDAEQLANLRRMLRKVGYGPEDVSA